MNVIADSKHDFTVTYAGASNVVNQCSTCHEMHRPVKMKPLWARQNSSKDLAWATKSGALPAEYSNTTFDNETSTMTAGTQIPKWALVDSRTGLCLSCHDGTQAVNAGIGALPEDSRAKLTVGLNGDLTQNHRIGNERIKTSQRNGVWTVLSDATLKAGDTVVINSLKLDGTPVATTRYFVGCTTCHSMHASPVSNKKLLVDSRDGQHGPVCLDCHGGK
jgi:predicted CXXCH cytochrome family protein